jgi:hypothetical protein
MICFPSMNHTPRPLTNLFELAKYFHWILKNNPEKKIYGTGRVINDILLFTFSIHFRIYKRDKLQVEKFLSFFMGHKFHFFFIYIFFNSREYTSYPWAP